MEYNFREIEKRWQQQWKDAGVYQVSNTSSKPKYYVLDMFPYPSGAGLHVGHPLGYIASDIYSRYKRLKGFNVLHPMGYDAFGLPAEQYAIEHGVHPADSTAKNIANFRQQLDNIGFCFDWSREVKTSDPGYYRWTQWIFLQLFKSWYNRQAERAEPINGLVEQFRTEGNAQAPCPGDDTIVFTAEQWQGYSEKEQQDILMQYRLAYCGEGEVNWCETLGTVLANDEVVNGVSERGGYPVVKKKLRQWYLRITEYAGRLQQDLDKLEWTDAMKEMQTNWIGKSYGAEIRFDIKTPGKAATGPANTLTVYTTRPDTIMGVDFMVVAPELDWIKDIRSAEQTAAVEDYIAYVASRSDRERQAEKKISGCFTGAYAINPFNGREVPIWISEYVLAGYGTGAIMAVPCGDDRDFRFARHFNIPVTNIIGTAFNGEEANPTKDAVLQNSGFLDGLPMRQATEVVLEALEQKGIGRRKTNYRMRDAAFSRQRYWGEPFPIRWENGIAYPLAEDSLPLELPYVDKYGPGPEGEGPLANVQAWTDQHLETNTMPGYAGSSWYFLRYMDPHNTSTFADRKATDYWNQVDVYVGGTEHAVGHLLYSRMWTKALFDLGHIGFDEPFKKLVNQGMIQGSSRFVYRIHGTSTFVTRRLVDETTGTYQEQQLDRLRVDVNLVDGVVLDTEAFRKWRNSEFADAVFITSTDGADEEGVYECGSEVEKMSKSKFNTVNPDDLVQRYGADTFRMYEMFLGPIEQSKPWDTKGIEGVHRFLKKLWRLFFDELKGKSWTEDIPTAAELKVLHRTIKKLEDDTERFSFNTGVSAFMVCVNELTDLKCSKRAILEPLVILLTPYAPHIAEELYQQFQQGRYQSVLDAGFPVFEEKYVTESSKEYPVSINGKLRTNMTFQLDAETAVVEAAVLDNEIVQKWMEGKPLKKMVYVKGKMINVVV